MGIYYYGARWYDSSLGRWLSPDTMIPAQQGVMGNDRYAYTNNNAVRYTDPSGHGAYCGDDYDPGCLNAEELGAFKSLAEPFYSQQPTSTSTPAPIPTLDPNRTWLDTMELNANQPTPVPICPAPPNAVDITPAEWLAILREIAGQVDLGPDAFTGTNLGFEKALGALAEALEAQAPGNLYSKMGKVTALVTPLAATGYSLVYDQITNTGEYSSPNYRDIISSLTTSQTVFTIISILYIIPILPP